MQNYPKIKLNTIKIEGNLEDFDQIVEFIYYKKTKVENKELDDKICISTTLVPKNSKLLGTKYARRSIYFKKQSELLDFVLESLKAYLFIYKKRLGKIQKEIILDRFKGIIHEA